MGLPTSAYDDTQGYRFDKNSRGEISKKQPNALRISRAAPIER
jgi:hypothetical protein